MKPPDPDYGPQFSPLLATAPLNDLGPGQPISAMHEKLVNISLDAAFAPHQIANREMAEACLAGLWLRFDFLDESHTISQEIHNPTGSFWHGIMHRREPDYENAKYWFRRVGDHEIFPALCAAARTAVSPKLQPDSRRDSGERSKDAKLDRTSQYLATQDNWDPYRFIDLVASTARCNSPSADFCRQIQLRACRILFDFCYRQAIGYRM
jgi:hypothetical protein